MIYYSLLSCHQNTLFHNGWCCILIVNTFISSLYFSANSFLWVITYAKSLNCSSYVIINFVLSCFAAATWVGCDSLNLFFYSGYSHTFSFKLEMELNVLKIVVILVVTSFIHSPLKASVFKSKIYEQHCDLGLGTPLTARIIAVNKVPTVIECLQACREASSCRSVDVDNSTAGTLTCTLLNNNDGSSCFHNSSVTHYRQVSLYNVL